MQVQLLEQAQLLDPHHLGALNRLATIAYENGDYQK